MRDSDYTYKLYFMSIGPIGLVVLAWLYEVVRKLRKGGATILNGEGVGVGGGPGGGARGGPEEALAGGSGAGSMCSRSPRPPPQAHA